MNKVRILIATLLIMCASVVSAQPMNYNAMRNNARFLTDRMAYNLGITSGAIIDDIYRINFDYICGINEYLDDVALGYYTSEYKELCIERDRALQYLLGEAIWNRLMGYDYFYRPVIFENHRWRFGIYSHDMRMSFFYRSEPNYFHDYRGGHFFGGMDRKGIQPRSERNRNFNSRTMGINDRSAMSERRDDTHGTRYNYDRRDNNVNMRNDNDRRDYNYNRNEDNMRREDGVVGRSENNTYSRNDNNSNYNRDVNNRDRTDRNTIYQRNRSMNDVNNHGSRSYSRSQSNMRSSTRSSSNFNSSTRGGGSRSFSGGSGSRSYNGGSSSRGNSGGSRTRGGR